MGKHYQEQQRATRRGYRRFRRAGIAIAACAIGAAGIGSFATVLAQDTPVTSSILDNGQRYTVSVNSTDVDTLLREAGIVLEDRDIVVHEQTAEGNIVTVKRQITASIETEKGIVTAAGYTGDTVGQLIDESGIALGKHDLVTPGADTQVWGDGVISIERRQEVYIVDHNVARTYVVPDGTANDAVESAGIQLGKGDSVANGNAKVTEGMVITINRATYEKYTETEVVDYQVIEEYTDELYEGETEIKTKGVEGEKRVTYKQTLVNGEVQKTRKISERVTKEPVDQIVLVGTKKKQIEQAQSSPNAPGVGNAQMVMTPVGEVNIGAMDARSGAAGLNGGAFKDNGNGSITDMYGNSIAYKQVLSGSCTAYFGGAQTSIGLKPQVGIIAVNPNVIPYGTRLFVASADGSYVYGYGIAGDTGGAMMNGQALVDLYMNNYDECTVFGRRNMNVYVLG